MARRISEIFKLIILPPAARFLKKLKEKPLKNLFQKTVDEIIMMDYGSSCFRKIHRLTRGFAQSRNVQMKYPV